MGIAASRGALNGVPVIGSRRLKASVLSSLGLLAVLFALFPGRRLGLAFTIGTGVRRAPLQGRITEIEDKASRGATLSGEDRAFLADFYRTLATGAKLSIIVRQTGRLMDHYLSGTGSDYRLDSDIFSQNAKVRAQMTLLRKRAQASPCMAGLRLSSPTFYMPDSSKLDSIFGLYHGVLRLERHAEGGACTLHWRAEVPWFWPSYASLQQEYGTPHGESFPLPNLQSILFGREHALYVDNGLGEYLAEIGLAKPFLAYGEWDEAPEATP